MIKELTELVSLSTQAIPNALELLGLLSHNNRDVLRLYHAVQNNNFRTEAEAIQKACVGERTKFRQVAKELLRCMESMVLHIGFEKPAFEGQIQARLKGYQLMATVKTLAPMSCKNAAKRAADELLRLGQAYSRPEFVVEASKALMDYVAVAGDDPKEFDTYYAMYEEASQSRLLEEKAQIYLEKIRLPYVRRKSFQRDIGALASHFVAELEPFVGKIASHHFHLSFFSLKSYRFAAEALYKEASRVHDEAIDFFTNVSYPCDNTLTIFYYLEIINCFYLGNYRRGAEFYEKAIQLSTVGNFNWFGTLELGFYLRMYEADYKGAADIYATAVKHKRFNVLRDTQRETWNILGAYLYIVQQLKGLDWPEGMAPKVKSSRFRNEIKDFSQDKTGMNIAILAAEVLLEFVEGKDGEMFDRISALEKYRERYLRNSEDTHRSQLFIKILVIFSKYNYDADKFLDKAQPYLDELRKAPLQLTNQAHELEIIPYEQLARLLAEALGKRKPKALNFQFFQKLDRVVGISA